jgi:uncharacterized protein (TIGR03067 family)
MTVMRIRFLFTAVVVTLPLGLGCGKEPGGAMSDNPPPATSKDDLTLLVGTWSVEKAEFDGLDWSDSYQSAKFKIAAGGKYTFAMNLVGEEAGAITLDPAKSPKEMDMAAEAGPTKGRVQSAIYKLDGDKLTVCLSMYEGKHPTEFETKTNSARILLTYKRTK